MKWYYKIMDGHTHVRVFMNGGKCGDLCFRNEEFRQVRIQCLWIVFIDEDRLAREDDIPTVEAMKAALLKAEWKPFGPSIWKSPDGKQHLGPTGAYRKMIAMLLPEPEGGKDVNGCDV